MLARIALFLLMGVGLAGFGVADSQGKWTGMDVDVCRAVAGVVRAIARGVIPLGSYNCQVAAYRDGIPEQVLRGAVGGTGRGAHRLRP